MEHKKTTVTDLKFIRQRKLPYSRVFKSILSPTAYAFVYQLLYRQRLLLNYIFIGILSLCVELFTMRGLHYFNTEFPQAKMFGLVIGIAFAFWLNVRFNFKVPVSKRYRALIYFVIIAIGSATLSSVFKNELIKIGWGYEQARFVTSGVLFIFAYVLHRRFSFVDRKQVGVAVYANGVEDIQTIRNKIEDFPDFIHVDLIDSTFGDIDSDVRSYRLEAIRAYWPYRDIHVHMMTRNPLKWLPDIVPYADVILVHFESDDPLDDVFETIRKQDKQVGLCLALATPIELILPLLDKIDVLLLLAISRPGHSGQSFQHEATLEKIARVNALPDRSKIILCIDGGVSEKNIHLLNVELVVSGSSVLKAESPIRQIMRLQTSNNHEAT